MQASDFSNSDELKKLQRRLAGCYLRGMELMSKQKDYDYAHLMLAECVLREPSNLKYVEALLENSKLAHSIKKRPKLFGAKSGGSREFKKVLAAQEWDKVLKLGLEQIKQEPGNAALYQGLARACEAMHLNEVELAYLKRALDCDPKSLDVNRHCARSLARMGQFEQSIACWHRVEAIHVGDSEAAKMIAKLCQESLLRPTMANPPSQSQASNSTDTEVEERKKKADASKESMDAYLTPMQLLEIAIKEHPEELSNYLVLAEMLCESEQYAEAEALLKRAEELYGKQDLISEKLFPIREALDEQQRGVLNTQSHSEKVIRIPFRVPWLELGLFLAAGLLLLQFYPAAAAKVWDTLDFREWTRVTWFLLNLAVVGILLAIRYGPRIVIGREEHT